MILKTLRGTPKHLSRTGQLEGFTYLMLTLPFKCNYRCLKCFNLVDNQPVTTGNPITLNETLQAIRDAKALGGQVVVIAGEGEPTLDPNIRQMVSYVDDLGMIPIVYTNGSVIGPEIASFYRSHNVCLVIALDSLKADVYEHLMGTKHGMLAQVLSNIENLRRVYADTIERRDDLHIVRLALNMTVCSRNVGEIEEIKALVGDDLYFVCNPLARHGNAVGNWKSLIDTEAEHAKHTMLAREHSESGGPLTLDRVGLCGYSVNGIGIGPFGDYMTCAYTAKTNGLLSTVRDRSLREAYEYKAAVEREHYGINGRSPCLVRAESFDSFVDTLHTMQGGQPAVAMAGGSSEPLLRVLPSRPNSFR